MNGILGVVNRLLIPSQNLQFSLRNGKKYIHTTNRYLYQHFDVGRPHDYWLPVETMPKDVDTLMKTDPSQMDYFGNYWYWRIRGESTLMDSENLPKKTYKQLTRDLGMQVKTAYYIKIS